MQPKYDICKFNVNTHLYQDNMEFDKNLAAQRDEISKAKRIVNSLKGKESQLKWNLQRKAKA